MAGVWGQRRRHPVEADVVRVEVRQDRVEVLEQDRQVGSGLPPAGVVRRQAPGAEDLDGEPETHSGRLTRA